jgi:hypothetical protein
MADAVFFFLNNIYIYIYIYINIDDVAFFNVVEVDADILNETHVVDGKLLTLTVKL